MLTAQRTLRPLVHASLGSVDIDIYDSWHVWIVSILLPSYLLFLPLRVRSSAAKASALWGLSLTLLSSSQAPDTRLYAIAAVLKFQSRAISRLASRTPVRHVLEDALPLLSNSHLILTHVPLRFSIMSWYRHRSHPSSSSRCGFGM